MWFARPHAQCVLPLCVYFFFNCLPPNHRQLMCCSSLASLVTKADIWGLDFCTHICHILLIKRLKLTYFSFTIFLCYLGYPYSEISLVYLISKHINRVKRNVSLILDGFFVVVVVVAAAEWVFGTVNLTERTPGTKNVMCFPNILGRLKKCFL